MRKEDIKIGMKVVPHSKTTSPIFATWEQSEVIKEKEANVTMTIKEILALGMFLGEFGTANLTLHLEDALAYGYNIENTSIEELVSVLDYNGMYRPLTNLLEEVGLKY